MPGEMGRHNRRACRLDVFGQLDDFFPAHPALQHVHRGDAENQDEIIPDSGARLLNDLCRKPHPVLIGAAILVGSEIGLFNKKAGNQIACGADNLDAIIARLFGEHGAIDVVVDLFLYPFGIKFCRCETCDR